MVGGCHFQAFWVGSKPVRSIFLTFLEPGKKSENFFSRKNRFFFGKNRDLSEIIGIYPKNRRFFAEIFSNDFFHGFFFHSHRQPKNRPKFPIFFSLTASAQVEQVVNWIFKSRYRSHRDLKNSQPTTLTTQILYYLDSDRQLESALKALK